MAARSYFGKSAKDLSLADAALLAGITKGPNFYNPERHPDRARERIAYVLGRMQAKVSLPRQQAKGAGEAAPARAARTRGATSGFYFSIRWRAKRKSVGVER